MRLHQITAESSKHSFYEPSGWWVVVLDDNLKPLSSPYPSKSVANHVMKDLEEILNVIKYLLINANIKDFSDQEIDRALGFGPTSHSLKKNLRRFEEAEALKLSDLSPATNPRQKTPTTKPRP